MRQNYSDQRNFFPSFRFLLRANQKNNAVFEKTSYSNFGNCLNNRLLVVPAY